MEPTLFKPLKFRRLSEMIETYIRDSILSRQIPPGRKLPTESEIARQFGVSIVTAREALRGLEVSGFIEKRKGRHGGIFATEIDSQPVKIALHNFLSSRNYSARDLGQVRRIIEPATIRIAAANMGAKELKRIAKNVQYCHNKLSKLGQNVTEKEFFDIEERHIEFHRLIAELTHNPVLSLTVDYLMDFLFSFAKSMVAPNIRFSIDISAAHHRIYKYLERGEAEKAEREMIDHIECVQDYLTRLCNKK